MYRFVSKLRSCTLMFVESRGRKRPLTRPLLSSTGVWGPFRELRTLVLARPIRVGRKAALATISRKRTNISGNCFPAIYGSEVRHFDIHARWNRRGQVSNNGLWSLPSDDEHDDDFQLATSYRFREHVE